MIQRIYYRNIITRIQVGTPPRNFTLILDTDDDRHFFASTQTPKISNEPEKEVKFYQFDKSELLDETYSSTYKKGPCEAVDYKTYFYANMKIKKMLKDSK